MTIAIQMIMNMNAVAIQAAAREKSTKENRLDSN